MRLPITGRSGRRRITPTQQAGARADDGGPLCGRTDEQPRATPPLSPQNGGPGAQLTGGRPQLYRTGAYIIDRGSQRRS